MIAGAVRAAERLQIVAEFDEIETGNGADALELRPQLASAFSCFLSKGNSLSCMFVRPLRVGTNNVICSCFSARQYPWLPAGSNGPAWSKHEGHHPRGG